MSKVTDRKILFRMDHTEAVIRLYERDLESLANDWQMKELHAEFRTAFLSICEKYYTDYSKVEQMRVVQFLSETSHRMAFLGERLK